MARLFTERFEGTDFTGSKVHAVYPSQFEDERLRILLKKPILNLDEWMELLVLNKLLVMNWR